MQKQKKEKKSLFQQEPLKDKVDYDEILKYYNAGKELVDACKKILSSLYSMEDIKSNNDLYQISEDFKIKVASISGDDSINKNFSLNLDNEFLFDEDKDSHMLDLKYRK